MTKTSGFQTVAAVGIISFLLFFVNILVAVSYQVGEVREQVQDKLGVYFYLTDTVGEEDAIYAKAIDMMTIMQKVGLEVTFYSKDDAFNLLAKRLPNVIDSLQQFNIDNPLPPTVYVLFDNQEEYEKMKTIVLYFEDIIVNLEDVTSNLSFGEQEQRVAKVVNLMNFLEYLSYFLIAITIVIVVTFLSYAIKLNFFRFHRQLEVEKLLGAPYIKIIAPFLVYIGCILLGAFILMSGYVAVLMTYLNTYFLDVFAMSLYDILPTGHIIGLFFVGEVVIILLVNLFFASSTLWGLLRKI